MAQKEKDSLAETQTYRLGWARCHVPYLVLSTPVISGLWLGLWECGPRNWAPECVVCCVLVVPKTGA